MSKSLHALIEETNIDSKTTAIGISPVARVSVDQYIDYHAILDNELDHLSNPEGGVMGSIGFTALGGAIGLLPMACGVVASVLKPEAGSITISDLANVIAAALCVTVAIICLAMFFIKKYRTRGLLQKIRNRPKFIGDRVITEK